jgi:hypothetical protein
MDAVSLLLQRDVLFWIVGGGIAVIWILAATIASMSKSLSRERTRREIAAYIAEGAMTPEQGEKLMKAGEDADA